MQCICEVLPKDCNEVKKKQKESTKTLAPKSTFSCEMKCVSFGVSPCLYLGTLCAVQLCVSV